MMMMMMMMTVVKYGRYDASLPKLTAKLLNC